MSPAHEHAWAAWAREGDEARTYWRRNEWGPYASFRDPTRSIVRMEAGGSYHDTRDQQEDQP